MGALDINLSQLRPLSGVAVPARQATLAGNGSSHRVGRVLSFSPVVGIGTPPTPRPQASVPPPFGSGGSGTLAGERGGRKVPIPTRGHFGTLFIYVLCGSSQSRLAGRYGNSAERA
jgi:hypothetical protein